MRSSIWILGLGIFTIGLLGCHGPGQKSEENPITSLEDPCAPAKYQANIWKKKLVGNSVLEISTIKPCPHSEHLRCLRYYNPILEKLSEEISELDTELSLGRKDVPLGKTSSANQDGFDPFPMIGKRNNKIRQREGVMGLIRYHSGNGCTAQADTETNIEKEVLNEQAVAEARLHRNEPSEVDVELETSS